MKKSVILLYMYNGFLLLWDRGTLGQGSDPCPRVPPVPTIFNIMEKDNA